MNWSTLNMHLLFDRDKSNVLIAARRHILHDWRSVKDAWDMKWAYSMVKILNFFSLIQIVTGFLLVPNLLKETMYMRFGKIYFQLDLVRLLVFSDDVQRGDLQLEVVNVLL